MPPKIKHRYPPIELPVMPDGVTPIMLLFIKAGNTKYPDFYDENLHTCIYCGQRVRETFDKLILNPNLRKLIVRDYNNKYNIDAEVISIKKISKRIYKNKASGIDPEAPKYKIKFKEVTDIVYDPEMPKFKMDHVIMNNQYKRMYELFHYYKLEYIKTPGQSFRSLQTGIMLVTHSAPPEVPDDSTSVA